MAVVCDNAASPKMTWKGCSNPSSAVCGYPRKNEARSSIWMIAKDRIGWKRSSIVHPATLRLARIDVNSKSESRSLAWCFSSSGGVPDSVPETS